MSQAASPFRTVLVTRPAHQASGLMTALTLRGYKPVAAPVLEMHTIDMAIPAGDFDALVFTSANAVTAFAARDARRDIPVFAVGPSTAAAARKAHFEWIMAGNQGAAALAEIIGTRLAGGSRVLHPAGRDVAVDLGEALADSGISVERVTLYAMDKATSLPADAIRALDDECFALLFSARSVEAMVQLASETGASLAKVTAVMPIQTAIINDKFLRIVQVGPLPKGDETLIDMLDSLEAVKWRL